MEDFEYLSEIVQVHGDLSANAIAVIGFFKSGMEMIPPFIATAMSDLFQDIEYLNAELYFDHWFDEENEEPFKEGTPDLIYTDYHRLTPYREIFEEWSDIEDLAMWKPDKDTIIQTLSYLIGDISRFYSDLSKEFPYKEDQD